MLIRRATNSDLEALFKLYRQLESPDTPLTRERLADTFARMRNRGGFVVWVAEDEGTVVGTFLLAILDALGDRCRAVAIVEDIVVDREQRGRGVGRAMMMFAREQARQAGCYKLTLSSNLTRSDAHSFYESLGFVRHGYSFRCDLDPS